MRTAGVKVRSLSRLNIIPSLPHHLYFVFFFFFNKGKTKQKILSPYAADSRKLDCIHPSGSNTKDLLGYFKQMWSLRTAQKASQQCDFFFLTSSLSIFLMHNIQFWSASLGPSAAGLYCLQNGLLCCISYSGGFGVKETQCCLRTTLQSGKIEV